MGFSIRSKFAHDMTLFNAGSSSQFLYKLTGCNDDLMQEFNSISTGNGRARAECRSFLTDNNMTMEFSGMYDPIYNENLFLIRESMSRIMAWCVKDRLINSTKEYEVKETVERMVSADPLKVHYPDIFYQKVMKDFLIAGFTGMTAEKKWDGKEQENDKYFVVMDNGNIAGSCSINREEFREYLYRNTHFEYVSADKYAWSRIIKKDESYYLPLNVSVRFNTHTR